MLLANSVTTIAFRDMADHGLGFDLQGDGVRGGLGGGGQGTKEGNGPGDQQPGYAIIETRFNGSGIRRLAGRNKFFWQGQAARQDLEPAHFRISASFSGARGAQILKKIPL